MAPAKRKRPDQSFDGNRPSPHRPADTAMGQRGRDGHDGGGRGGRGGGRNGRRNDRRDSTQNQTGQGAPYNHQQHASSPTTSRHQTPRAPAAAPPPAPPVEQPPSAAPAPAATLPAPISSNYPYEILTDDKIASWDSGSRQALIEHGVQSRQDVDITELSSLFQEFVQSVAEYRLNPTDAGACVKEILGPETKEVIKDSYSFEPHTLLLDTITIIMDNQPDLFIPEFRDFLIATAISPTLIRQVLDAPLLQKLGLIREVFGKMAIRHSTNMLYRQANYNLLREESEGYSKLVTELFSCVDDYDTPTTREAEAAFEKIKGLIGTFDLDVGRVLDVALDVHATSLVKASKFFVKLLRVSSWWPRSNTPFDAIIQGGLPDWALPLPSELDESAIAEVRRQRDIGFWERAREKQIQAFFELGGRRASEQDLERAAADNAGAATEGEAVRSWITATRTLPPQGNRVAAQLLGFKLRFYASDFREGQALPANLLYLAALLIKIGFISLIDLYAHLFPYDDDMESFRDKRIKQLEEKERESRGEASKNALLTAGALSDDTLPPPVRSRDTTTRPKAASKPDQAEGVDKKEEDEPHEQKGALVISLLTIGAIPEALFLIGRWPWLLQGYPDITSRVNRILEYSIDKLYQETRPTTTSPMACPPKKVADSDQSGVTKGSVRRSEISIRKSMRWPWPDGRLGVSDQHYRFYWDEWSDNVPVCQTVDDVFTLSSSLLNISGVNIGKSEQLLVMLASIGQKSLAEDQSKHNLDRWQDLLRRILVPALSTSKGAPATANLVWSLLKQYPIATRYSIYADWFEGAPNRGSEVRRAAMVKAFADTKSKAQGVMKRISKDNAVEMGRALAKLTHSSPGVVFKVALELMMSYGNLSDVFAECVRFFTDLTKDVMIWSLLSALGSNQRSRTQASYILSISPWLLELSKLTGKLFKRYRELDATPILRYVHDQLLHGNSTDLIILSELVDAMGGIVNTADIGYDEVIAMSGMALLQRRTLISLQDRRFEPAVIASAKRLTHALVDSRLAGRLLVNIAQFRQSATFRLSDDGAHVKYLSSLMDNSHQILVQYLDLLRANLDPAEFDRLVPSISQLMAEFGLDASFAFSIGRESLAAHIFSKPTTAPKQISQPAPDAEGDVSMGDDATATEPAPDTTKPETPAPEAPGEAHVTAATSFDALNPIVESLRSTTPESAWQKISIEFFAIFWALQLGDLGVPWAPYHAQQARLQEQYRQVTKDRKLLQAQRSAKQKELKDTMDTFIKESTQQSERVAKAKVLITKRMDTWFMGEPLKPNGVSDAILGQCLLPRIILSKIDSEYSFALIKYIHELSCPNFRLMALYDRLFKANRLRGMLFTCTVQEGVYLGHFFHLILRELNKWHKSSADYEKEAIGKSKRSGGYLGFVTAFDEEGHPISHLDHAEFQDVLYGWHKNINLALKACLSGTEWTHIRNAISFLTEAHEDFPAVTFMGTQLQNQLKTIVAREKNLRGDLWLTAQRVLGNMAKMEKTWIAPQAFRTNLSTQSAAQGNEDEQASSSGGSLRATAPEFRPS
ncbi:THO complex subunit 2 like protein [Verticillium longisporum]|uniref:THO complex subunit 2 n=1 Tax=Verticillium longisporum TaxID=100787 RepID=A0A8I3AEF2_VERLO|nr:THO complex subunit 2 like protein [Verticillium longisporum]